MSANIGKSGVLLRRRRNKRMSYIAWLVIWCAFVVSCNRQTPLTPIQQQRAGDYIVSLLSETGTVKQRAGKLALEFRNASSNQPVNVTNVQVQANMQMAGMGPMLGNTSAPRQTGTGRFDFDVNLSMAGQWNFVVTFDPQRRVQFNLNAQ